jgi:DNA-binding PadR family transcriptional regulator
VTQGVHHLGIGYLVQDVRVHEPEHLARKVLGQLRDEHQSKPALSASFCNPRDLLEKDLGFFDPLVAEELMGLLDASDSRQAGAGIASARKRTKCIGHTACRAGSAARDRREGRREKQIESMQFPARQAVPGRAYDLIDHAALFLHCQGLSRILLSSRVFPCLRRKFDKFQTFALTTATFPLQDPLTLSFPALLYQHWIYRAWIYRLPIQEVALKGEIQTFLPLTPTETQILLALASGERHGYAIMQEISEQTDGRLRVGPGSLYGTIKRLLAAGLIIETAERADPSLNDERRRYYEMTELGRKVLIAEIRNQEQVVELARAKRIYPRARTSPA